MRSETLAGKIILFVVAPVDFRDEEYFEPKELLAGEGATVVTASLVRGELKGTKGGTATSNLLLNDAVPGDYDAVVFIGGSGAQRFFDDPAAHRLAREAVGRGKIAAAICIAPATLANAGLLKGKKATSFPSERARLAGCGAVFTGTPVECDGAIITASGPAAAREFGAAIAKALADVR